MTNIERFIKEFLKVPVVEFKNQVSQDPLVSICVQTYQQADYIGKCLDGILMQKTNFDFEILVGEDESSDNTRDVCIEYAKKYPKKIRLFLHTRENNIAVYGKPSPQFNFRYNMYKSKGKYMAICEGDDFWTDPLKLQKQVDFLEANNEYGLIYSDVDLVGGFGEDENTELVAAREERYKRIEGTYKSGDIFWDLLEKNRVNTLTVCTRQALILDYFNSFYYEDFAYDHRTWLHVASYSKIKHCKEIWGSYRSLEQGISNAKDFFNKRSPLVKQSALINYLKIIEFDSTLFDKRIFSKVTYNILKSKYLSKEEKKPTIDLFKHHPKFLLFLLKWRIERLLIKLKLN